MSLADAKDFSLTLENDLGEKTIIGYNKEQQQFYIDRTKSGKVDFEKGFAAIHTAPRFTNSKAMNISLIIDVASVELFADGGLTTMTEIFFPNKPYNSITLQSADKTTIDKLTYTRLQKTIQP